MIADLVLNNTKSLIAGKMVDCNIAIDNGKIVKIGTAASMPPADQKINLNRLITLPGLIDAHVHLRDQGKAYKEDFRTGTAAAAAGGFTTVLDMPNNDPVTMSASTLNDRKELAEKRVLVNVGFYSEFPVETAEIAAIVGAGAVGFKLFMAEKIGGINPDDDAVLAVAFAALKRENVPVAVHAEDGKIVRGLEAEQRRANRRDIEAFLAAHPENAETKALVRLLQGIERTGTHLHVCHVSTRNGLSLIANGRKRGLPITCEVTPHHMLLSTSDLERIGTTAITMPPVRDKNQAAAFLDGIANGSIDMVGSDHAPHALQEKTNEDVWNVKVGVPGLETTLPLMLTEFNRRLLSLADLARLLAEAPARTFGLEGKGKIEEGGDADLTIIDLDREGRIDPSRFHSKAKFSPFEGWHTKGVAVKTIVGGKLVMDEGHIVAEEGSGRVLRRKQD